VRADLAGERMPNINFILPLWLYWTALVAFPLVAMFAVYREQKAAEKSNLSVTMAYVFWVTAGFIGMHRFYVRSRWGYVFIPLFAAVIYANFEVKDAHEAESLGRQQLRITSFDLRTAQDAVKTEAAGAEDRLAKAQAADAAAQTEMNAAVAISDHWRMIAGGFGGAIGILLLIDAFLLPRLVRECREKERRNPPRRFTPVEVPPEIHAQGTGESPTTEVQSRAADILDWTTEWSGRFVSYWTLLSIFVYYYEVVVRFVFNSPTNWVHESMFLMYGMQYLICGAYALKQDAHVRVDVFYVKFSRRGKALADIVTSFFFYLFTGTMLVTGWIYASQAVSLGEVSFSEWAVQYWPIKLAIPIGAALILLQGTSRLIKDFKILVRGA
jgi:TRAP-type mannitol/chloroaromatic compound transport system permease small subunit